MMAQPPIAPDLRRKTAKPKSKANQPTPLKADGSKKRDDAPHPSPSVKVRLHGAALLFSKIDDAGHTKDLKSALGETSPTMTLDRKTFLAIKSFVKSKEDLASDHSLTALFDCDHNDPDDFCF